MWTHTTYSDRIIILTRDKMRMSFKSSDIMHVQEFSVFKDRKEADGTEGIKTSIITKVGNELESYIVDQDFNKIIKLLYPQTDGDVDEVGTNS